MKKIIFKIKQKLLIFSSLFGQKKYMKKIVKLYKKAGVVFEGMPKYIDRNANLDIFGKGKIYVGRGSVITTGVTILTHDYSIDCGLVSIEKENKEYEAIYYKDVHIGNNTFVGQKCIVLPGVSIGDNCIIGSGCVVSKNIP
ncbi:MAG: acyltransferase, partial [Intestinibacter sp.]|uniref:acyltransferase n=1 Tax=Intestinibacter sp. TaxID=1965304 RepID=UPI003F1762A9